MSRKTCLKTPLNGKLKLLDRDALQTVEDGEGFNTVNVLFLYCTFF